jgi:hypothetical protein
MFTMKPPLQFLGASSGNMRKHAYSWKYNSVIWQNASKLNATGILAGLRKSQMANDYMVSPSIQSVVVLPDPWEHRGAGA